MSRRRRSGTRGPASRRVRLAGQVLGDRWQGEHPAGDHEQAAIAEHRRSPGSRAPRASRNRRPTSVDGWTPRPTSSLTTMVGPARASRASTRPSMSTSRSAMGGDPGAEGVDQRRPIERGPPQSADQLGACLDGERSGRRAGRGACRSGRACRRRSPRPWRRRAPAGRAGHGPAASDSASSDLPERVPPSTRVITVREATGRRCATGPGRPRSRARTAGVLPLCGRRPSTMLRRRLARADRGREHTCEGRRW